MKRIGNSLMRGGLIVFSFLCLCSMTCRTCGTVDELWGSRATLSCNQCGVKPYQLTGCSGIRLHLCRHRMRLNSIGSHGDFLTKTQLVMMQEDPTVVVSNISASLSLSQHQLPCSAACGFPTVPSV